MTLLSLGLMKKERYETLKYLSQNNIKVNVFGNGWQNIESNKNLIIKKEPIYRRKILQNKFFIKNKFRFFKKR